MKDALKTSCQILRFEDSREQENRFVRECQAGGANAWTELVKRHTRYVHSLCFRFTRRDCEASEITQEVFLRVFCTLNSFRPEEQSFVAWLTRVTRNLLIDNYRRNRRQRMTVSIEDQRQHLRVMASPAERPDGAFYRREANQILSSALLKVPSYLRETIALYEIDELRYRDIARLQGIPIGTVKSRLRRGRTALAHLLRKHRPAA